MGTTSLIFFGLAVILFLWSYKIQNGSGSADERIASVIPAIIGIIFSLVSFGFFITYVVMK